MAYTLAGLSFPFIRRHVQSNNVIGLFFNDAINVGFQVLSSWFSRDTVQDLKPRGRVQWKRFSKCLRDVSEKKHFLIFLSLLTMHPTMPYLLPVELAFSTSLFYITDPTLSPCEKKIRPLCALCGTALPICEWKAVEKHFKTQNGVEVCSLSFYSSGSFYAVNAL